MLVIARLHPSLALEALRHGGILPKRVKKYATCVRIKAENSTYRSALVLNCSEFPEYIQSINLERTAGS